MGSSTDHNMWEDVEFSLRDTIPAGKVPRKIVFPTQTETTPVLSREIEEAQRELTRQREFEIDAAVIRLMKASQRLEWNHLQVRIVEALADRFLPETPMVKRRIESLIQRDFLRRDERNQKLLFYVA
jgi:hypothetical protein